MRNIENQMSKNVVQIVGKVLDATVAEGTTKTGKPYARANVTVRVVQTLNGKTDTNEIVVPFFSSQYTNNNTINPAFDGIQKLKNIKTAQLHGIEEADTIAIRKGSLRENNFVSKNTGSVINGWQLSSSFYSIGGGSDLACFQVEIFIMDMHDEVDRDGDPTGRLIIKGGIVQYAGRLDVVEFVVEDPECVDFISRNWNINDTVEADGFIRVTSREVEAPTSSWGQPVPESTPRFVRELIITSGSDCGYEEDLAYDATDIRKAFQVRKATIDQMMQDAKKPTAKPKTSNMDWE